MKKSILIFISTNYLYIIWAFMYIMFAWLMLGDSIEMLLLTVFVYAVTIAIALSPIGESYCVR